MVEKEISAYEILPDGKLAWRAKYKTDENGLAVFDLDGINQGKKFKLRTKVFNQFTTYTDPLSQSGDIKWRIGKFRVNLVNGSVEPNKPYPEQKVVVEKKNSEGKFSWFGTAVSDSNGILKLDLSHPSSDNPYRLRAPSPVNGRNKYSQEITKNGDFKFVVGTLPLSLTLKDDESGKPIVEQKVTAYEILEDGSKKWRSNQTSDSQGQVQFDLDGLGQGRKYRVYTKAFSQFNYTTPVYEKPGNHVLRLGTVRVKIKNGSLPDHPPLNDVKVSIQRLQDDGKFKYFASANSGEAGTIKVDLPDLDQGAVYRLTAASTITGAYKASPPITESGNHTFVVGNPEFNVRLVNAISGDVLSGQRITVYELLEDGNKKWIMRGETGEDGKVYFDLNGIGSGRNYVLYAEPYNGGRVVSPIIQQYGAFDFMVGSLPLTLIDEETQNTIAGKKVSAFQVLDDGKLKWRKKGVTDEQGRILFDLEGLAEGHRYVFKAEKPFDDNKHYYSRVVQAAGEFSFVVSKGNNTKPDLIIPEVAIVSPDGEAPVPAAGFTLSGTASDNIQVTKVLVEIAVEGVPAISDEAEFDADSGSWSLAIPATSLQPEKEVRIKVTALDATTNMASVEAIYQVAAALDDALPPEISVSSHQSGDTIPKTGVTIRGTATDDVALASLLATVVDPVLGETISAMPLTVDAETGGFELVIRNGQMTVGEQIRVVLEAQDTVQRITQLSLDLLVGEVSNEPGQVLSRLTFGATPELITSMSQDGVDVFLGEQLDPDSIDDSELETMVADAVPQSLTELRQYVLQHQLFTRRQLKEVMTWFWENHFNTNYYTHRNIAYEFQENQGFRRHALGRFRDLLEVSAKSPAMIFYLNNAQNVASAPNENYAREIMELHTLGVDGGYTSQDVAELAKVFTGWHVQNDAFFFNAAEHNTEDKTLLGQTIPGGGLEEGEQALDILASHPSTATFICGKLAQLLVTDTPESALVNDCADTFLDSGGVIARVVERLVLSPEFASDQNFRSKVKTPLEMVTSVVRNLSVTPDYNELNRAMQRMGINAFVNPVPTGWSEVGEDWINGNLLLQRTRFVNDVAFNTNSSRGNYVDIHQQMLDLGLNSAEAIVVHLLQVASGGEYTDLEYQIGIDILNEGEAFDLDAADADTKLRRLLGHVLSFPGYHLQ